MGTHVPYGITQCYLPPSRGDIPAFTPAEAGTQLSDPGGMQGCADLVMVLMVERCIFGVSVGDAPMGILPRSFTIET